MVVVVAFFRTETISTEGTRNALSRQIQVRVARGGVPYMVTGLVGYFFPPQPLPAAAAKNDHSCLIDCYCDNRNLVMT